MSGEGRNSLSLVRRHWRSVCHAYADHDENCIILLFAALPPAVMQFMLAERYAQEPERVAAMVLLGNALAVVFVPLGLALSL